MNLSFLCLPELVRIRQSAVSASAVREALHISTILVISQIHFVAPTPSTPVNPDPYILFRRTRHRLTKIKTEIYSQENNIVHTAGPLWPIVRLIICTYSIIWICSQHRIISKCNHNHDTGLCFLVISILH